MNCSIRKNHMNTQDYLLAFEKWYKSLKTVKANSGPANGTIAATLVLLERLKEDFNINFESHLAPGGAQIKGASGSAVAAILKKFDEYRPFAKEGGRTNRGGQGDIRPLFQVLSSLNLASLNKEYRDQILTIFQQYLVDRVRDFHNRQKLKLVFNPSLSTWQTIHSIIDIALGEGKAGYVAQHLIGAKLQLRFPNIKVSNESASTADRPTNRSGDFRIGDTVFHVTVSPMTAVFEKCNENLKEGLKVFLIVPDASLVGARQWAMQYGNGQIAVESIESFVSQNIEEISLFESSLLKTNLTHLIRIYNERIDEAETDKSLMIELPSNLK